MAYDDNIDTSDNAINDAFPPSTRRFSVNIPVDPEEEKQKNDIEASRKSIRIEGNEDDILAELRRASLIVDIPNDDIDIDDGLINNDNSEDNNISNNGGSGGQNDGKDDCDSVITVQENIDAMKNENVVEIHEQSGADEAAGNPSPDRRSSFTRRLSDILSVSSASALRQILGDDDGSGQSDKQRERVDVSAIEILHIDDSSYPTLKNHKGDKIPDDFTACDSEGFVGMIISPFHHHDDKEFLRKKFKNVLVCGVFSVCILGCITILLSLTVFRDSGNARPEPPTPLGVTLPDEIELHFADWDEEYHDAASAKRHDVPIFWSIPLTGSSVIEEYLGGCLGLIQASEAGIIGNTQEDADSLKTVDIHGLSYVNVDLRTRNGIEHATRMHLIDDHSDIILVPDVLHTPLLYESSQLFENPEQNQGQILTILRDPLERAVALYQQIQSSESWIDSAGGYASGGGGSGLSHMTLVDYAKSGYVENNWLTRALCNKPTGELTEDDLKLAKEILRRKVLVGMYDNVPLALSYFKHKFGWKNDESMRRGNHQERRRSTSVVEGADFTKEDGYYFSHCTPIGLEEALKKASSGGLWVKNQPEQYHQPVLEEGSLAWSLLKKQNEFDIELFEYAKTVHKYQFSLFRRSRGMSSEGGQ